MVGYNRDGFKSPEFQSAAMHYMLRAIVRQDRRGIDEGWRAIDATFRQQTEKGNFGREGAPHGGPSAVAFWLAELDQAILVLRESKLGPVYRERIEQACAEDSQGGPVACPASLSGASETRRRRCTQPLAVRRPGLWAFRRSDRQ